MIVTIAAVASAGWTDPAAAQEGGCDIHCHERTTPEGIEQHTLSSISPKTHVCATSDPEHPLHLCGDEESWKTGSCDPHATCDGDALMGSLSEGGIISARKAAGVLDALPERIAEAQWPGEFWIRSCQGTVVAAVRLKSESGW